MGMLESYNYEEVSVPSCHFGVAKVNSYYNVPSLIVKFCEVGNFDFTVVETEHLDLSTKFPSKLFP